MNMRNGVVACGIALLMTTGAMACSSGGGSGGSGSSSPLAGSSLPSWAKSLGSGVQVIPPGSTKPGDDTPADVITGLVTAVTSKNYKSVCQYYQPSQQSSCESAFSQLTPAEAASAFKDFNTIKPSWTVIDGDQALVGLTGTSCGGSGGKCTTNNDPTAVLDSGKPFSQLYQAADSSTTDAYEPAAMVKVNGKWYSPLGN